MSYQSKTKHLKLPQWELSDKPDMLDYNRAFSDIDDAVNELEESIAALKDSLPQTIGTSIAELKDTLTKRAEKCPLLLQEGILSVWSPYCCKDSSGIVTVIGTVKKENGTLAKNDVLGYLPEGYRPGSPYEFLAMQMNSTADMKPCYLGIESNGNLFCRGGTTDSIISFHLSFLAEA